MVSPALDQLVRFCCRLKPVHEASILLTSKCPARCMHCNFWKLPDQEELSFQELIVLAKDLRKVGFRTFNITGGEPFLRDDIFDFAAYCTEIGIEKITVNTSGLLFSDRLIKRIINSSIYGICLSLDGDENIHDQIRGVKGTYGKVIKTLDALKGHKKLNVSMEINSLNYNFIEHVVEVASRYSATFTFQPFEVNLYNSSANSGLQITDSRHVDGLCRDLLNLKQRYPSVVTAGIEHIRILKDYLKDKESVSLPCFVGSARAHIDATGNVFPCYPLKTIDSIRNSNFIKIWNSAAYKEVRKKMLVRDCPNCLLNCYTRINLQVFSIFKRFTKNPIYKVLYSNRFLLRLKGVARKMVSAILR